MIIYMNKKKKGISTLRRAFLVSSFVLQLWTNTPIYAQPELDEIDFNHYATSYNRLPSVEENNAKLNSSVEFFPFLKEAEEIITRYEFKPYVGFRLVHSHFRVGERQLMVEEYELINGSG